jgi:DNA modification methylase
MVRYETFYVARKGDAVLAKAASNVFLHDSVPPQQRISITEKPVSLYEELLTIFLQPSMRVVCPFLGSGNFMLACYKRNITCYGWDLSETNKERFVRRVMREFGYVEPTQKVEVSNRTAS